MRRFEDYFNQKIKARLNGSLIYFSMEGNDEVGYICKIQTVSGQTLYFYELSSTEMEVETSIEAPESFRKLSDIKSILFIVSDKIKMTFRNQQIESLELIINCESVKCLISSDDTEYTLVDNCSEESGSYVFIKDSKEV